MQFQILGPLEVRDGDRAVALGGAKQRALLALLLLRANQRVSMDRLVDALWPESARDEGIKALQVAVSRLRRALDDDGVLVTRAPGYEMRVEEGELDADWFERCVQLGRSALARGDAKAASEALREGLALWRGPALDDLGHHEACQADIARLEELRLAAQEDAVHAELDLRRHAELVGDLERLLATSPLRERLRRQLMLALYRSGRQAEALEAYQDARAALTEGLGIEPSRELRELQHAILTQDSSIDRLRARLPADPGPPSAPLRLPLPHTRTVGRSGDLARLRELLRAERLLTLVGAGGIGKTRLAVELARAVHGEYADGARFVSLATTDSPDFVADTVGVALGLAPLPGEAALSGLTRLIGEKEMLLVLDNFEHVLPAAQFIGELLDACAGLRIVATSREPLRLSSEQLFVVRPLALPAAHDRLELESIQRSPAVSLFAERCRAREPGFTLTRADAVSVAEICKLVDGMP